MELLGFSDGGEIVKAFHRLWWCIIVLFCAVCAPVFASVSIVSFNPSSQSPQPIGKTISWTATATDTGAGPLTFQFNVALPRGSLALVKDFNVGTLSSGTWTAVPFVWVPTRVEGIYQVQVVIKDFGTGETTSKTVSYVVKPLVTGSTPVVKKTANPLVALFSEPSCAAGSEMRVVFQEQSGRTPATGTNWAPCHPPATMTFEVAGMLPGTAYDMYAETQTGGHPSQGSKVTFTTGSLPTTIPFPKFKVSTPPGSSNPDRVILHSLYTFSGGTVFPDVATNLSGNIIWYYYPNNLDHTTLLTRPLPGGEMLYLDYGYAWNPSVYEWQFLRQIDLAGNIVRETNIGVLQQQLKAKGSPAGGACPTAHPAPVGSACIGQFHHEAIQTLPNGFTAVLVDEEKLFPAGTQGDTSGLLVDVIGDMILVLNNNWQLVWYWDAFDPAGGGNGYPLLPVTRTAMLGEFCEIGTLGCPPMLLLGNGVAAEAHDWLHANSLYYWPAPADGNTTGGDIVLSLRHQDWVLKIDYKDGSGTGDILWRLGDYGDFTFVNTYNDPWPWFSHQHDAGIEDNGTGVMSLFDNGNTRVTDLGSGCKPYDCDSRGMALTLKHAGMTATPALSLDLGSYSDAMGSAQLLSNGNYFFENPLVLINLNTVGYSLEYGPTPAAPQAGPANTLFDQRGPEHYRAFQMPSLYHPPET
jgi:hypothetical protein